MPAADLHLEDLLSPISPEEFLRETWETRSLFLERGDRAHYAGLLSRRDLDQIIAFTRPKFPDLGPGPMGPAKLTYVRGVLEERPLSSPPRNPGVADLRQLFDHGKTLVIMAMQHRWPAVATLCRNLETVFHCPVHANMYLTPAGSQGFAAHYDPHEVFVLQLEGRKHWRVYDRIESLPLLTDSVLMPKPPLGPFRDVYLNAGDLLYIPRGQIHEAFTADDYSMHLTVGINVYRWTDLMHHALAYASRQDKRFRESIPGGALPAGRAELKERFKLLLASLADSSSGDELFDEAMHRLGDEFIAQLPMLPGSQFAAESDLDQLTLDTIVDRDPQAMCRFLESEEGVAIEFPGNRVGGPHRIASALRFVARATRFAIRELPNDLSAESKLVLARRLVREGLLMIVKPTDSTENSAANGAAVTSGSRNGHNVSPKSSSGWESLDPAQRVQHREPTLAD